jgi:acyl-CoA reductase-like NAD-dependent aldehyde dehydrogenase
MQMNDLKDNLIAGEWKRATSYTPNINPSNLADVIAEYAQGGAGDVDAAVAAATAAFPAWATGSVQARSDALDKIGTEILARREELGTLLSREEGKTRPEGIGEVTRAGQIFKFFAGECLRLAGELLPSVRPGIAVEITREPVGVVGLITPWNFPFAIPAWKAAPALAYGNAVVMKLAQEAPLTGLHLAACLDEAEIPAGVFNIVIGRGSTVGTPLVAHPSVRAISFTGSVPVGEQVRSEAASTGKRVQLELGGHNPLIVAADADLDRAVEAAYAGAFWSAGQKCTATRRIYVEGSVYDDVKERLLARMERGVVGDPADPETEVGPIVNEAQLEEVLAGIERGKADGGTLLAGGVRLDDDAYLLAPALFEGLEDDAFLSCEEVFGPVTTLYSYTTLDEALERANAVRFGLSAAIFTSSLASARQFAETIEAGIVRVNGQTAGADVHVPFGGIKGSGYGPHEQGRAAREFYTDVVTVYEDV